MKHGMLKKFNLIIVSPRFYPLLGGGENQARLVSKKLAQSGHHVTIFASKLPATNFIDNDGEVQVIRVPSFNFSRNSGLRAVLNNLLFVFCCSIMLLYRMTKYDIVYFFWGSDYFSLIGILLKLLGKPTIIRTASMFSREIGNIRFKKYPFLRLQLIRCFDAYIAISGELGKSMLEDGISKEKIVRVGNCVDEDKFFPLAEDQRLALRSAKGLKRDEIVIIFAGHLNQIKGLDFFSKTINQMDLKQINTRVYILGSGKFVEDSLEATKEVLSLKSNDRVEFFGAVENIYPYYQIADIFVLPSKTEGMPNSLLEAMSCGLACVATSVGAVPEIITNHLDGILITHGDEAALKDNLIRLCGNHAERQRLGLAARQTIIRSFSVRQRIREYESLFRRLIDGLTKN